jgi:hypothetical protein
VGWAAVDLICGARVEMCDEVGLIVFGTLLVLAAAFVRVRLPGGLAFAIGAMLGLQALAVHDAVHLRAKTIFFFAGFAAFADRCHRSARTRAASTRC